MPGESAAATAAAAVAATVAVWSAASCPGRR